MITPSSWALTHGLLLVGLLVSRRAFLTTGLSLFASTVWAQVRGRLRRGGSGSPPPPPPGGGNDNIGTFTVLDTGWITLVAAAKKGDAPDGLIFGNYSTQNEVLNRWSDNSVKMAICVFKATAMGNVTLKNGTPVSGTFNDTEGGNHTADVSANVTTGEVTGSYPAALTSAIASEKWIDGPLCQEDRTIVIPRRASDNAAHPTIRCLFDRRRFNDGTCTISYWWVNIKDNGTAQRIIADYTLNLNGSTVRGTETDVWIPYLGFWRRRYSSVGHSKGRIQHAWQSYEDAKVIEKFRYVTPADVPFVGDYSAMSLGKVPGSSNIYLGPMPFDWPISGKRAQIGIASNGLGLSWASNFTLNNLSTIENLSQAVGIMYGTVTRGDGVECIDTDTYQNYWMHADSPPNGNANPADGSGPRNCNGGNCHVPDVGIRTFQENQHKIGDLHVWPFLATGDHFYYNMLRQFGMNSLLQSPPSESNGVVHRYHSYHEINAFNGFDAATYSACTQLGSGDSPYKNMKGIFAYPPLNQHRGIGRSLHEFVNAWVFTRDSETNFPTKTRLKEMVETNIDQLEMETKGTVEVTASHWTGGNPLKIAFVGLVGFNVPFVSVDRDCAQNLAWCRTYIMNGVQFARNQGLSTLPGTSVKVGDYFVRYWIHTLLLPLAYWTGDARRFSLGQWHPFFFGASTNSTYPLEYIRDKVTNTPAAHMAKVQESSIATPTDTAYMDCPPLMSNHFGELYAAACIARDLALINPLTGSLYDTASMITFLEGDPEGTYSDTTRDQYFQNGQTCGHNLVGVNTTNND